jgi:DNA repair protein RecO (recombination protein O)
MLLGWHDRSVAVYRDSAVVLRVGKLGEADRIVTLLSRRSGRVRAVAKGVRRTKSRFGGRLEPFSHVDVQLHAGRSLDTVTQAVTLDPFGAQIASDYARYTAATVIAETADRLSAEERQPWLRLYLLVVSALRALAEPIAGAEPVDPEAGGGPGFRHREPGLVMDAFLLRAMALAGWAPALKECARCAAPGPHAAFHVPSGGMLCADCRGAGFARPAPATLTLMGALSAGQWDIAEATGPEHRREASGLVAALVQFHLERGLRSLPLVDRASGMTPSWPAAPALAATGDAAR